MPGILKRSAYGPGGINAAIAITNERQAERRAQRVQTPERLRDHRLAEIAQAQDHLRHLIKTAPPQRARDLLAKLAKLGDEARSLHDDRSQERPQAPAFDSHRNRG